MGIRTSYSPHVREGGRVVRYGDVAFWMTDGSRADLGPLFGLRSIQVSYQSGWDWRISGEVQPWEETDRYERKLIRERFDLSMLNRYCRALGIRRDDAHFYGPRATLMEEKSRPGRKFPMPGERWWHRLRL